MNCLHCQKQTTNAKFCSRTCANSFNNSLHPKRKKTVFIKCKTCGNNTENYSWYCSLECRPIKKISGTIQDVIYTAHHKSSAFALIRGNARTVAKQQGFCKCHNCDYDKHIEVCHIKSISSFPLDTLVSEVNNPKNLLPLCPNCHWEHDNGLLII